MLEHLSSQLKQIIEENYQPQPVESGLFRASELGDDCLRKVWYSFHAPIAWRPNAKTLMAMSDGERTEEVALSNLLKHPDIDFVESQEEKFSDDGLIRGHCDAILRIVGEKYLWEHKACEEKYFNQFIKKGLSLWNKKYYTQVTIYMKIYNLSKCLFQVSSAGFRNTEFEIIEFNQDYYDIIHEKALMVKQSKNPLPKISEDKNYWKCRGCQYYDECHNS